MDDATTPRFDQDIVRALRPAPEIRASGDDGTRTMVGHFSVFNTWYEVHSIFEGRFLERVAPGAFEETIAEDRSGVKVTFNHGYDVLGDQVLGTIDVLREDDIGAYYEVPLFRSVPDLIVEGLEAGVYGSSFRFKVAGDEWEDEPGESPHNPRGLPERTITKVRPLMEFGAVTFPASPTASAGIRSLTDEYYERLAERSPSAYEAAVRSAKAISTGRPDTRSAGGGGTTGDGPGPDTETVPVPVSTPQTTPPEPERKVTTVDTATTLTIEERRERVKEIVAREKEIDAEHNGAALSAEARDEWDKLEEERLAHQAAIEDAEARKAHLADVVARSEGEGPAGARPAPNGGGRTPGWQHKRTSDVVWDLAEIRREARSIDELPELYREHAKRAIDRVNFPNLERRDPNRRVKIRFSREDAQRQVEHLLDFVDDKNGTLARRILVTGSPVYERAFGKAIEMLHTMGLSSEERAALALGAGATGGFAVPFQLDPTVILTSNGSINPLRQISRVEQIVGKEWDGVTSTGITVTRVAEATEAGDNAPTLAQPTVKAERVQGFVPFSMEIEQDWAGLRSEMTRLLSDAKDQEEATSFVTGTGVSPQANGVVATLGAGSNVVANTFGVANLYNLEEAVPPRFRSMASILGNKFVFNLVRQFDTAGGAALWVRLGDGLPPELIGYPAYENSSMVASVGTIGNRFLLMGDFSQFLIVDRVGMSIELVPHLFGATNRFPTGQRGIYAIWRNNSKILTDNAFRILHKAA